MAPPEHPFPVSDLEHQVHYHNVDLKEKSRKLPKDFNLKRDCELLELVQYSCTTQEQQYERALESATGTARTECFPFVRLFRKCQHRRKVFHVETTAWEGEHAWRSARDTTIDDSKQGSDSSLATSVAKSGRSFWPLK